MDGRWRKDYRNRLSRDTVGISNIDNWEQDHTKDMKQMKSSTDVAVLTRKVEWQVLYTVLKS